MKDTIYREDAIKAFDTEPFIVGDAEAAINTYSYVCDVIRRIKNLPPAQPEYEPVTIEDFAKTMSENTLYGFMAWHGEALELMERQGFVICKKTM